MFRNKNTIKYGLVVALYVLLLHQSCNSDHIPDLTKDVAFTVDGRADINTHGMDFFGEVMEEDIYLTDKAYISLDITKGYKQYKDKLYWKIEDSMEKVNSITKRYNLKTSDVVGISLCTEDENCITKYVRFVVNKEDMATSSVSYNDEDKPNNQNQRNRTPTPSQSNGNANTNSVATGKTAQTQTIQDQTKNNIPENANITNQKDLEAERKAEADRIRMEKENEAKRKRIEQEEAERKRLEEERIRMEKENAESEFSKDGSILSAKKDCANKAASYISGSFKMTITPKTKLRLRSVLVPGLEVKTSKRVNIKLSGSDGTIEVINRLLVDKSTEISLDKYDDLIPGVTYTLSIEDDAIKMADISSCISNTTASNQYLSVNGGKHLFFYNLKYSY